VKLVYVPGWHQPETVLELTLNKDRWDKLSEHERGLIEGACLATLQATLTDSAKLQALALANLAKEGVKIESLPESVLAALRASWGEIAKEEGDRDYFFKTVLDDIEKFVAKAHEVPGSQAAPAQSPTP
jgi:TRAP-type mannitol/chloroaromatic compound transport system substrate-binding protein